MRVKICGITNIEDALYACECGADALGFIFYEGSPRYVSPIVAKEIISNLPPFVEVVGLFVNHTAQEIEDIATFTKIHIAQIHFEADSSFYDSLSVPHIKVIRAKCKDDLLLYKNEYRFVDAFVDEYGGQGKRVNLEWFEGIDTSKIILAGGLNHTNLEELIGYKFYGVDVSSGVEATKGKKDFEKVKKFIQKAKNGFCEINK